ncbi:MAG: hypothetical protein GWN53_13280 [Gammaproteobacteria bacterium]|nr:hypothetical protein [Gammaproteobacteria bacterium]
MAFRRKSERRRRVSPLAILAFLTFAGAADAQIAGNPACPGEEVFFEPNPADIIVPPGYEVEVFASGLNFPTNIAFRGNTRSFEVFVTEVGTGLPGRCNGAEFFESETGLPAAENPFLPQVRVLDQFGNTLRILGRPPSVAQRGDPEFLHAPTIGVAFEREFQGGRLFVTDSRQGVRGALGPKNSSRVVELDPGNGAVTELITGLPTGDHPTEQITIRDGFLYWSQGSVTNTGVVGHDNGAPVGGPAEDETGTQHEIPCEDVMLSGNGFDSGDGHVTGGFLPHGQPGVEGQVVPAFTGATQAGMCSGAILRASLGDPQETVEPVSWGYRNPFGIRFAPDGHPLRGALLITENGEDERGARPTNQAPDRLHVVSKKAIKKGELDFHGWPDRFGFLDSTQAIFTPIGGPGDDNPAGPGSPVGQPVAPLLQKPPQPPVSPLAIEETDVAVVGLDFAPGTFAGGGNPGNEVVAGDALVTREGDFGFSPPNGDPIIGHDIERVHFLGSPSGDPKDVRWVRERFAFNCREEDQFTDLEGTKRCSQPANQAFVDQIGGINRPVDGKFGPDGAFYLVDFGAVRDFGQATPGSQFQIGDDAPLVQIPGTGVIWRISRTD